VALNGANAQPVGRDGQALVAAGFGDLQQVLATELGPGCTAWPKEEAIDGDRADSLIAECGDEPGCLGALERPSGAGVCHACADQRQQAPGSHQFGRFLRIDKP